MLIAALVSIGAVAETQNAKATQTVEAATAALTKQSQTVTEGTTYYRDFLLDNVLHTTKNGDIHYNLYVPKSYAKSKKKYALYVTLPGYQGLYFQGVGQNIMTEDFGFEAMQYNSRMIILAPQLNDWGATSADQTIALVKYFLKNYRIDSSKVYISGYSGGGETLSLVLSKNPELFKRALLCSSQWDGNYTSVVKSKTPVYLVVGESDEYYGSTPFKNAYNKLYKQYQKKGYTKKQINSRLVLDVKSASYFQEGGVSHQHGGGAALFSKDEAIMGWLFK
jgi:predicted peptidase